ncbi:MAG: hypothetical protein ACRDJI_11240 [Actinomycetota bacterium]
MTVKAKLGAGQWDLLFCEDCGHSWNDHDIDYEWTDEPESGEAYCPGCQSTHVVREERG